MSKFVTVNSECIDITHLHNYVAYAIASFVKLPAQEQNRLVALCIEAQGGLTLEEEKFLAQELARTLEPYGFPDKDFRVELIDELHRDLEEFD